MKLLETFDGMYAEMQRQGHELEGGDYAFYISNDLEEQAPLTYKNLPVIVAAFMPLGHAACLRNPETEVFKTS